MELVKYEAACRAVAEAKSIDEVREISGRAEAARAYAKQFKNRQMEMDAIEIRVRAERRLGELIIEMKRQNIVGYGFAPGTNRANRIVTLPELGIDGFTSAAAQRIAMLPENKFTQELSEWRSTTRAGRKLANPLQHYRTPSASGNREQAAERKGKGTVDTSDPFQKYRADGRRVADWRIGELGRLMDLALRMYRYAEVLQSNLPVANADMLATMEMVYRHDVLKGLLEQVWNERTVGPSDAGIDGSRIDLAKSRNARKCEQCGKEFLMNRGGKGYSGKSNEGRFCSRACLTERRRAISNTRQ